MPGDWHYSGQGRLAIKYPLGDVMLLAHQVRDLVGQPVVICKGEHAAQQPYRVVAANQYYLHPDGEYVLILDLER